MQCNDDVMFYWCRYEGTGRSLSLKLIDQLRQQSAMGVASGRVLKEVVLDEPIRYSSNDVIERWLYNLLCLDCMSSMKKMMSGCPSPTDCQLYVIITCV